MASRSRCPKESEPQWLIIWWCPRCKMDSGRTDRDGPLCYFCNRSDDLLEIKREKLTKHALLGRMKFVSDRLMDGLKETYDS